jgi:hypothetical protein
MTEKDESEYCKNFKINQSLFRIKRLYNKPLTRFNLSSPYYNEITGEPAKDANDKAIITKERLDMRRKAEILKYSSNRMSTQTNNMTKKEKWAQLANARGKSISIFDIENVICPNDALIPMPSSASGVPGSTYLYEDPSVPLYNYTNINRTYAFDVPNRNEYWDTTVNTNVRIIPGSHETIFAIVVNRIVNNNTATYALTIPLGIHLNGIYTNDGLKNVTAIISSATLFVYRNNILFKDETQPVDKSMAVKFPSNLAPNSQFSATQYVGDISFSEITLELSDAYVFEFKLALTTDIEPSGSFNSYTYANITDSVLADPINCSLTTNKNNDVTISTPSLFGRL